MRKKKSGFFTGSGKILRRCSIPSFSLDRKRSKKIKANAITPLLVFLTSNTNYRIVSKFNPSSLLFFLTKSFGYAQCKLHRTHLFTPLLVFLTSNTNYRIISKFNPSSLLFFLTKKVTKKSRQTLLLRSFAIPPTYGVTENGSIVCIRMVRNKDEDSGACCAATPAALCSVWVCL